MRQDSNFSLQNINNWTYKSGTDSLINGYQRLGSKDNKDSKRLHFLHGTGFCSMTLAPIASQLPEEWSLWFTDVPGHGLSNKPKHRMPDWNKMAMTVAKAINQQANVQQDGPVIGVGHSMGAVLTLLAAAHYPQLFSRIILLDPVFFKPELVIANHLMRVTGAWKNYALVRSVNKRCAQWPNVEEMKSDIASKSFYRNWHPQVIENYVTYGSKENITGDIQLACDPRWESAFFGSYPKGLWKALRKVSVPVDILVAKKSYSFIPKAVKRAAKVNDLIQWKFFDGTHCFPMEQPGETASCIKQLWV